MSLFIFLAKVCTDFLYLLLLATTKTRKKAIRRFPYRFLQFICKSYDLILGLDCFFFVDVKVMVQVKMGAAVISGLIPVE